MNTNIFGHEFELNNVYEQKISDDVIPCESMNEFEHFLIHDDKIREIIAHNAKMIPDSWYHHPNDCRDNNLCNFCITNHLERFVCSFDDLDWINKEGKFPKRVFNHFRQMFNVKLSNDIIGVIGDLIRRYMLIDESVNFDLTDKFNWNAGDFGDSGSCYWESRCSARDTLEYHNALAFRTYGTNQYGYQHGLGRVWIGRYSDNDLIFFNAYGEMLENRSLSRERAARIFCKFFENTTGKKLYSKSINLTNNYSSSDFLYINGGKGILVSSREIPDNLGELDFMYYEVHGDYSEDSNCWTCENCGNEFDYDDDYRFEFGEDFYCESCRDDLFTRCHRCHNWIENNNVIVSQADYPYCDDCYHDRFRECESCGGEVHVNHVMEFDCRYFCESCYQKHFIECDICHVTHERNNINQLPEGYVCDSCMPTFEELRPMLPNIEEN